MAEVVSLTFTGESVNETSWFFKKISRGTNRGNGGRNMGIGWFYQGNSSSPVLFFGADRGTDVKT